MASPELFASTAAARAQALETSALQRPQLWLGPLRGACASLLQPQELAWGRALPPLQRRRYWQSRAALRRWLASLLGCAAEAVPLHSPPGAPPRLADDQLWISLSHSGDGLLLGASRWPIGVDLEWAERPLAAAPLMRRFFPPQEVRQLELLPAAALPAAVLTSWVLKEAAIKSRRGTLAGELACWGWDHQHKRLCDQRDGSSPEARWGACDGWLWAAVGQGAAAAELQLAPWEAALQAPAEARG